MMIPNQRDSHGFSLIETIVTMAILAVLLAVLLPVIGHAVQFSRSSRDLSTLRTHAQSFSLYFGDFGDILPYFTDPGHDNVVGDPGVLELRRVFMFDAHRTWHLVLGPLYYDGAVMSEAFFPSAFVDSAVPGFPYHTPFHYPCTFVARPEFWNQSTRHIEGQFGPTSSHEVTFPSMKALVVLTWPFTDRVHTSRDTLREDLPTVMVDASARRLESRQRLHGYNKGDGVEFIDTGAVHFTDYPPLLHTIDGVRGRDTR